MKKIYTKYNKIDLSKYMGKINNPMPKEYISRRVGAWVYSSSDNSWQRNIYDKFISCERVSYCSKIIQVSESEYAGACMYEEDIIRSVTLKSLAITLDILILNRGWEISEPFIISEQS
tara:strand:+ start:1912 stop:2265 length:354 start_codon:yes stop_codon:yes gene_type:complete